MRRKRIRNFDINLNLVPMLDGMITIIAFLMYTLAFIAIVSIESPIPLVNRLSNDTQIKEVPLQLTLSIQNKQMILYSPFQRVPSTTIPHLPDGMADLPALRKRLLAIKDRFPFETKIVFMPGSQVAYDQIIAVMDSVRARDRADPPLYARNPKTGLDELITSLFPNIVFGNLLGGES